MWNALFCSVCNRALREDLSTTLCGHVFHSDCIRFRLILRGSCPICSRQCSEGELTVLRVSIPASEGVKVRETRLRVAEMKKALDTAEQRKSAAQETANKLSRLHGQLTTSLCEAKEALLQYQEMQQNERTIASQSETISAQASEVFALPAVRRAVEIRAQYDDAKQCGLLYSQVVALSQLVATERLTTRGFEKQISDLEQSLRNSRWHWEKLDNVWSLHPPTN